MTGQSTEKAARLIAVGFTEKFSKFIRTQVYKQICNPETGTTKESTEKDHNQAAATI